MGHPQAVMLALVLLLAPGCATVTGSVQKVFRSPGERLDSFPEAVWKEYDCDSQKRPFLVIEKNELIPARVKSGGEFGHRFVYAMCPQNSTEVVAGRLSTRIRFKGQPIVGDTIESYEIKPGRWVVDAFVRIPENAAPGIYAYELAFESGSLDFDKSLTFVVRQP